MLFLCVYDNLFANTTNNNSAFGYKSLVANTTGVFNVGIGYRSLYANTVGAYNTSLGGDSLKNNITGNGNSAFGTYSGYDLTGGIGNTLIGYNTGRGITTGNSNTIVGSSVTGLSSSLSSTIILADGNGNKRMWIDSTGNVGVGTFTPISKLNTYASGSNLSVLKVDGGNGTLFEVTDQLSGSLFSVNDITGLPIMEAFSNYNVVIDKITVGRGNKNVANTLPVSNVAVGYQALNVNTTGTANSAFGSGSLWKNTSGIQNTAIGGNAGAAITTGTNLTVIGYNAAASSATATNEVTLGNSSVATLRCQVTTITALSDFRDKTDVNNIEVGLSFVEKLRPVTFKWDKREWYSNGIRDGTKTENKLQVGFIAQELKSLQEETNAEYLQLVYENNPDKLEATPGNLLIPLIKAVQELSQKVKEDRLEITYLKQQIEDLKNK